mmetsp:Transcript_1427/g.3893  ORF Transcript_1427/g.3893 Transcript_1427/m.3893 type:complete len:175 (-) Transcript_1427:46-570(-)
MTKLVLGGLLYLNFGLVLSYQTPNAQPARLHEETSESLTARKVSGGFLSAPTARPSGSNFPWNLVAMASAFGLSAAVALSPARALNPPDVENGAAIFEGVCVACHLGGNNLVVEEKKLTKEALTRFKAFDPVKIKVIAAGGQGAMPPFGDALSAQDLEDVAGYIMKQANAGWKD